MEENGRNRTDDTPPAAGIGGRGILFVGAEDEENLAIRSLAAFCRAEGIEAEVCGFSYAGDVGQVVEAVRRMAPAVVAVSVAFQCKAEECFAMLRAVRGAGFGGHVVVGGHFPTFEYGEILRTQGEIDTVLRFEGERGIVGLYGAVTARGDLRGVANLAWRDGGRVVENACVHEMLDLDALPVPLRGKRAQVRLGEKFASLISSRGCWHSSCLYCCIGAFHGAKRGKFALRSAGSVGEEIAALYGRGVRLFQFHDDNFVLGTPGETVGRLRAIGGAMKERGVGRAAFLIKARPDVVDEEVAGALEELGTVGVFLGVENATETGLRALARGADLGAVERAMEVLRRRGMAVTYNLLVFHPHATVEEVRANVGFVRKHAEVPFDFGRAEIVAGSPLERMTVQEGLRCGRWPQWDYRLRDAGAQKAFDVYRETFRRPGGAYSALMHQLIALAYHAGTVRRMYPGALAEGLVRGVEALLRETNLALAEKIEEMLALAESGGEKGAFVAGLEERCRESLQGAEALTEALSRLQAVERVFGKFGVQGMVQGMPRVAAILGVGRSVKRGYKN